MKITTEVITPEKAAEYLRYNTDNYRKLSMATVYKYAQDMKEGRWQKNGEGIAFSKDGQLKNGQHRLAAIIRAKVPVEMVVIRDLDDSVTAFDIGKNRSVTDMVNRKTVGDFTSTEAAVASAVVGNFGRPTKTAVLDWIDKRYRDIKRATRICGTGSCGRAKRMSYALAAFLMMEAEKMGHYEVETFFRIFNTGETIMADGYETSSALTARKMFEEQYPSGKATTSTNKAQTEILVKALTDFRDGTSVHGNYLIKDPLKCVELMQFIRKQDGLERGDR